jgi:hypothetical protein
MVSEDHFVADLDELQKLAEIYLMDLAREYVEANNSVATTGYTDFVFSPFPASAGTDQVYQYWSDLRDQLIDVLGRTATNYEAASAAMLHIVKAYEETDAEAARRLHRAWQHDLRVAERNGDKPVHGPLPPVITP